MTRLLLLRHGQTTLGPRRLLGRADPGLDDHGRRQAVLAGRRLAGRRLAAVVTSPLRRARETAALAVPHHPAVVDERWQEIDLGELEGLTWEEVAARHPEVAQTWLRRRLDAAPGGEPPTALLARACSAALDAARRWDGDVLVVAHGGPIAAVRGIALGLSLADCWRVRLAHGALRVARATPAVLGRWSAATAAGGEGRW